MTDHVDGTSRTQHVLSNNGFLSPPLSDPNRLAPESAFYGSSNTLYSDHHALSRRYNDGKARQQNDRSGRSRSRRRNREWKKILWIKQPYPDNYTDPPTFLSHLQRNPRFQPYDFWPLVADSMVIVQHVCAVAVFISCFVGIYQEHVSPVSVVGSATACTLLGWLMWDMWLGQEDRASKMLTGLDDTAGLAAGGTTNGDHSPALVGSSAGSTGTNTSHPASAVTSPTASQHLFHGLNFAHHPAPTSYFSPHNQQRLATFKSALLIYCVLLGLSPILKSLTKSTTSDSIWAMSCWLLFINVFFFDYGGGKDVKFPASLSTNAALMASTVLASRLPSTTHVFSLTLFSIEVFGLFPVFRRHLRERSWGLHVLLTILLIVAAGAGLGMILMGGGTWKKAILGSFIWGFGTILVMGGCSWWLIGLQRYKNVVIGPWDPARPVIRAGV